MRKLLLAVLIFTGFSESAEATTASWFGLSVSGAQILAVGNKCYYSGTITLLFDYTVIDEVSPGGHNGIHRYYGQSARIGGHSLEKGVPENHSNSNFTVTVNHQYNYQDDYTLANIDFVYDDVAPEISFQPVPNSWDGEKFTVTVLATDPKSGVSKVSLQGGAYTSPLDIALAKSFQAQPGLSYTVFTEDNAGNGKTVIYGPYETNNPLLSAPGYFGTAKNNLLLSILATDTRTNSGIDPASFVYSLSRHLSDGSDQLDFQDLSIASTGQSSKSGTISMTTTGDYTLTIKAKDFAGDSAPNLVLHQVILRDIPGVTVEPIGEYWYRTSSFTVLGVDALSRTQVSNPNEVKVWYSTDGKPGTELSKTWISLEGKDFTRPEGSTTVDFKVVDEAGNVSDPFRMDFNIDTASPVITLKKNGKAVPLGASQTSPAITFANASDVYVLSSSDPSPSSGLTSFTQTKDGILSNLTIPSQTVASGLGTALYYFAASDAAGNSSGGYVQILRDDDPVSGTEFQLVKQTPSQTKSASSGTLDGNFDSLVLRVPVQPAGEAQPVSYSWKIGQANPTPGTFAAPSNGYYSATLTSALSEGEYDATATILDQSGNTKTITVHILIDRTAPVSLKDWIVPPNDGTSTTFTLNVPAASANVKVYQTGTADTLLWDQQAVAAVKGNFALDGAGTGTVSLKSVDKYGNSGTVVYTIIRPTKPAAPTLVKNIASTGDSFTVSVSNSASVTTTWGGLAYTLSYSGKSTSTIGATNAAWTTTDLSMMGAYTAGQLGSLTAWGKLSAPTSGVGPTVIALDQTTAEANWTIPNSAPVFVNPQAGWNTYLGKPSSLFTTAPIVRDPDSHALWYRYKMTSGTAIWYSVEMQTLIPDLNWTSIGATIPDTKFLASGVTVELQAWADSASSTHWLTGVSSISKTFAANLVDFDIPAATPSVVEASFSAARWNNANQLTVTLSDAGFSKLAQATASLTPLNAAGQPSGTAVVIPLTGLVVGSSSSTVSGSIPTTLSGAQQLLVTVTDRAGNGKNETRFVKLDYSKPAVTAVLAAEANSLGVLPVALTASDTGSGIDSWAYQQQTGDWVWSPWFSSAVSIHPNWSSGTIQKVQWRVRDNAGNESDVPGTWQSIHYDASEPQFDLTVTGLISSGNDNYVRDLNDVAASSSMTAQWSAVRIFPDGFETVSDSKTSWANVRSLTTWWVDGGKYRIRSSVTNVNGITGLRDSPPFVLDRTNPAVPSLVLVPLTDRGRISYYQYEPISVGWSGGSDLDTPVVRTIELRQTVNQLTSVLSTTTMESLQTQAIVKWGDLAIDWSKGGFTLVGIATNAATRTASSIALPVAVDGTGIIASIPAYTSGRAELPISWMGAPQGFDHFSYAVYQQGASSDVLIAGPFSTTENTASVNLTTATLTDGDKLFVIVSAQDSSNQTLGQGVSPVAIVDRGTLLVTWTKTPVAVNSKQVGATFAVQNSGSGVKRSRWLIEKQTSSGWTSMGEWRDVSVPTGADLSADLSGQLTSGDALRLTLRTENGVETPSQAVTDSILVDNTPPPVPLVVDQGDAVNYAAQPLTFNWRMSAIDAESGLSQYSYGWFYQGEATGPAQWTALASSDTSSNAAWQAAVDLRGQSLLDGKVVVLAVKAKNQAGLETIGYSNGIVLDQTAPLVYAVSVFANSARTVPLIGYVKSSSVAGKTVYLTVNAMDNVAWTGGSVQAYQWVNADWVAVGSAEPIEGAQTPLTLPAGSSFGGGTRWRFEAIVKDAAGNTSAKASSEGFLVEGTVPSVSGLTLSVDPTRIHLSWSLSDLASAGWVQSYSVVAKRGTQVLAQTTTGAKTTSFEWGAAGLALTTGQTVQFIVQAVSFAGEAKDSTTASDYQANLFIDTTKPTLASDTRVPALPATLFYDRLEGHLNFSPNGGVSSLQWSAIEVPGDLPLVDWQETIGASAWDFQKLVSEIRTSVLSTWQGKQVRIKVRAANRMGIWSDVATLGSVKFDTTAPELVTLTRATSFSKESNEVSGWTLQLKDSDSGLLSYMVALVPTAQAGSYQWPSGTDHASATPASQSYSENISIPLTATDEGGYTPLVRVRNGTNRWFTVTGPGLTIDRTAPVPAITWSGAPNQTLALNGVSTVVRVSNGPSQSLSIQTNEPVKVVVSGAWLTTQALPPTGYLASNTTALNFGTNPEGVLYPVSITLEDRAGNQLVVNDVVRYNRSPVITVLAPVPQRPGIPVKIDKLVQITDDEGTRDGDYALSYSWVPGNSSSVQTWTGGTSLSTVFGTSPATAFYQLPAQAQTTSYAGTLTVSDRYGKTTSVSLTILIENTHEGTLGVNEFWKGTSLVTGPVVVPNGKTLTLEGASVTVSGLGAIMNGGILVEAGGTLVVNDSQVNTAVSGSRWKGIRVRGDLHGSQLQVSGAERGITLEAPGSVNLTASTASGNLTGLHLLGGSLHWSMGKLRDNQEYGVKDDGGGGGITASEFQGNGVNYYRNGSILTIGEINDLSGNGTNNEVQQ